MSKHVKKRKYTTPEERADLIKDHSNGMIQIDLAAKYGITQNAVSKLLARAGVPSKPRDVANPVTFDVEKARQLYWVNHMTMKEISEELGVSQSQITQHFKKRGIPTYDGSQQYKGFNRQFFSVADPLRSYWAGFIAADGNVHKNNISFGLHPHDIEMLEKFKKATLSPHPISKRPGSSGDDYVWMSINCKEWAKGLLLNYKITPRKSLTLQPPELPTEEDIWAFVRGYFDGDGHASKNGRRLHLVSGSRVFVEWIIRDVFKAHHSIYEQNGGWQCSISGDVLREVLPKLYAGSTEETRLRRKYERFYPPKTIEV